MYYNAEEHEICNLPGFTRSSILCCEEIVSIVVEIIFQHRVSLLSKGNSYAACNLKYDGIFTSRNFSG
jgi:hypothetical protein